MKTAAKEPLVSMSIRMSHALIEELDRYGASCEPPVTAAAAGRYLIAMGLLERATSGAKRAARRGA